MPAEGEKGKFSLFEDANVIRLFPPEVQEKLAKHGYPLRRLGKSQDLANMVAFIASERASWVTGQTISVSGGYSMF
jgi:NAD(P)-dependent dehydrogenase (short-subunit alcohol dehydrogenase family)